ncbi:MAG: ribosome recycling factor [Paludibacteraceae bacterium]|nr:ribosome recycling factor [Paludibacteraceae bacterium]
MEEELNLLEETAEEQMQSAVSHLDDALAHIRAGKASPRLLDSVRVDYYGTTSPLTSVATVMVPDARTITIQPWEKKMIGEIERAIINSNIGLTPSNNGEVIRLNMPPLTEERRRDLAKQCKQEAETAKMAVRNARREAIEEFKKLVKKGLPEDTEKDAEEQMQKTHDKFVKKIDELYALKEKEIMTV